MSRMESISDRIKPPGRCDGRSLIIARHSPDMAQKRRQERGVTPTWRKNDVGTEAVSRHGAETMSGQRRYPDMAQKRCRGRGSLPTWCRNDVGAEALTCKIESNFKKGGIM